MKTLTALAESGQFKVDVVSYPDISTVGEPRLRVTFLTRVVREPGSITVAVAEERLPPDRLV